MLTAGWVDQAIGEARARIDRLLPRFSDTFPGASTVHGRYQPVEKVDWTEGFWTGMLWLLYEAAGDAKYREAAERFLPKFRERLDRKIKVNTTIWDSFILCPVFPPVGSPAMRPRGRRLWPRQRFCMTVTMRRPELSRHGEI
ncbi:hypothetical protein [Enterocloster asparagiformis]|uniref:hypothetical protein n=1 Tax=Enterocloster asparagiformis TaxID=333367 RepID=UPI0004B0FCE1